MGNMKRDLVDELPNELTNLLEPEKMLDLFELLDSDESGESSRDEFVDGVAHLALTTMPIETFQIIHLLRNERHHLLSLASDVEKVKNDLRLLLERLGTRVMRG